MMLHPRFRSALGGLFLLAVTAGLHAEGSPPLITDDPGTPGDGHWEINLGFSTEKRPGSRLSELPLLDLNYGIGDSLQLKYEVPYLRLTEDGAPSESGLGNSAFGVKWRFYDAGEKSLLAMQLTATGTSGLIRVLRCGYADTNPPPCRQPRGSRSAIPEEQG